MFVNKKDGAWSCAVLFYFMKIQDDIFYNSNRLRMVEEQLVARGIHDQKVLDALRKVPRHVFVPETLRAQSYEDHPLAIGEGQTISQPFIVAYMTQAL